MPEGGLHHHCRLDHRPQPGYLNTKCRCFPNLRMALQCFLDLPDVDLVAAHIDKGLLPPGHGQTPAGILHTQIACVVVTLIERLFVQLGSIVISGWRDNIALHPDLANLARRDFPARLIANLDRHVFQRQPQRPK